MSSKQYIGIKMVQAVPGKMVNGIIWPEGLPLPAQDYEGKAETSEEQCDRRRVTIECGYSILADGQYPEWISKESFEAIYRETDGMPFGLALEAMKKGLKVARWAWYNQSNETYVFLADGAEFHTAADLSEFEGLEQGVPVSDLLVFRTEKATLLPGWLPNQEDLLADDWYITDKYDSAGDRTKLPI